MSFVTWPARNSRAPGPVSASLPRSERSSSPQPSVSTAYSAARSSVRIAMWPRIAGLDGPGPVALAAIPCAPWPSRTRTRRSSTRCPTTGPTSSSTCGSPTSDRYIDAATYLVTCNAQPYSQHDWHWRLLVAHRFGHAAAAGDRPRRADAARRRGHRGRARPARAALGPRRGHADVGPPAVRARRVQAQPRAVVMAREGAALAAGLLAPSVSRARRAARSARRTPGRRRAAA